MRFGSFMQDMEDGSCVPGSFSAKDYVQIQLRLPSCVSESCSSLESVDYTDNSIMGNMLLEMLCSQVQRGPPSYSFEENTKFPESRSHDLIRTFSPQSNQTLEGVITPWGNAQPPESFRLELPYLQERNNQLKVPVIPTFQKCTELDSIVLDPHRGCISETDDQSLLNSGTSFQTFITSYLAANDCGKLAECSSNSKCSESCGTIATNNQIVETQEDATLKQFSPRAIDEGNSSGTQEKKTAMPRNYSETIGSIQPGSSELLGSANPAPDQQRSGMHTIPERKRRKRSRACKNSQEVESQRMTHIAVERNRRKQMNKHLGVLRSLMPGSFVHRGDQASILGGAIEFVKELEKVLQSLQAQKRLKDSQNSSYSPQSKSLPSEILSCSQFAHSPSITSDTRYASENQFVPSGELFAESRSSDADVEVKLMGSDGIVKVLSKKSPGQLLKAIAAMENLHLKIMYLNITTIEQTALYFFNVKIGVECQLQTVNDLANSVHQIFNVHAGGNDQQETSQAG